ncbi:hypothetical protein ABVK25_012300 [Lepraria finkii]|uniref:RRM domain-containing protein n=1 Tax=Lepraria finkii TaxID=1340010 RepID=A0ABR4AFU3_9LECA
MHLSRPPVSESRSAEKSSQRKKLALKLRSATRRREFYNDSHEARSIVIRGLSQHTTLADVTKVIRGGMVLNMYLRPRDRTAHVTFVDPIAAQKFIIYSKRSDIYIKGKRVEVYWAERQHYMAGHIARRIQNGATRNLAVRFVKPSMTPDTIQEDLDHIHNLDVVDIVTANGHAYISTNGVGWAVTAKTCLASRFEVQGHED